MGVVRRILLQRWQAVALAVIAAVGCIAVKNQRGKPVSSRGFTLLRFLYATCAICLSATNFVSRYKPRRLWADVTTWLRLLRKLLAGAALLISAGNLNRHFAALR